MNIKRFGTLFLSAALAFSLTLPVFAVSPKFSDVPSNFWAYKEINIAVGKGIINGYQDGTFHPTDQVTNAHFEAFVARAFYAKEISTYLSDPWYANYANVLAKHGVTKNTTLASNFPKQINQPINRYDMAMIIYNVLCDKNGELPSQQEVDAAQQAIGDWKTIPQTYQSAVAACYALGLLNGQADGNFGGNNLMNRAQACVVINRLSNFIFVSSETSDKLNPPDENTSNLQPDTPHLPAGELQPGQYDVNVHDVPADTNKDGFITEEEVQAVLAQLREEYPDFTPWGPDKSYYSNAFHANGSGCAAWAFFVSDQIFGKTLPVTETRHIRSLEAAEQFRSGDVCEMNAPHWSVFASTGVREDGYYAACAGNVGGGKIGWTDYASYESSGMDKDFENDTYGYVYYSRYPQ